MGSDAFMKELRATESSVPWHLHCGERVHLYLNQFGSFHAEPESVGSVLMDVQRRVRGPLQMINYLDDEGDD